MHIVLTDMRLKVSNAKLVKKLMKQNEIIKNSDINVVKNFETKRNNKLIYNANLSPTQKCVKTRKLMLHGRNVGSLIVIKYFY